MPGSRFDVRSAEPRDGVTEIEIGDFSVRDTRYALETTFTERDAVFLSQLLLELAARPADILIAFYPWLEAEWARRSANGWTSLFSKTFIRRWWFIRSKNRWEIGFAHTAEKLTEIVEWAWTLPGRDTLMFVISPAHEYEPLIAGFVDDREDDGENEARVASQYPAVVSRGYCATSIRMFSRDYSIDEVKAACDRAAEAARAR
jgi:hypothetical protein